MKYTDIINNKKIDLALIPKKTKEDIAKIETLQDKDTLIEQEQLDFTELDDNISADLINYLATLEVVPPVVPVVPVATPVAKPKQAKRKDRTVIDWIFQQ